MRQKGAPFRSSKITIGVLTLAPFPSQKLQTRMVDYDMLMEDVFLCVDAETIKHIFNVCIRVAYFT